MYARFLILHLTLVLSMLCWPGRATAAPTTWQSFRTVYPFHVQGVALSEPAAGGRRTLIIAEPPPHVTLAGLQQRLPARSGPPLVRRHAIGYDGWVADVEILLPKLSDIDLSTLISNLQIYLFKTTYKAALLDLHPIARHLSDNEFSLQVDPQELKDWLLTRNPLFISISGSQGRPFTTLLDDATPGVYFNEDIGLVIWLVSRRELLDSQTLAARQFTLDTDFVVGAIGDGDRVAIIGRQRVTATSILPPLRIETLLQLGAVRENELGQSYERRSLFAGKFAGGRDWAPIYLSPELIDTEFGSLLNITDQILKSFSNNGTTSYENFNYFKPPRWPFRQPVYQEADASRITYNWNTHGLGHVVDDNRSKILAFKNTGALPVTYVPEGHATAGTKTAVLESQAYEYFAGLSDPNLARVVQYTAFYQIFQAFGIHAHSRNRRVVRDLASAYLVTEARKLLHQIATADVKTIEKAAQRFIDRERAIGRQPSLNREDIMKLVLARGLLGSMQQKLGPASLDRLAAFLAARNLVKLNSEEDVKFLQLSQAFMMLGSSLQAFTNISSVHQGYIARAKARPGSWVHTPSLVVSWNRGKIRLEASGGHNLSAKVSHHGTFASPKLAEHFPRLALPPRTPLAALRLPSRTRQIEQQPSPQYSHVRGVNFGWQADTRSIGGSDLEIVKPFSDTPFTDAVMIDRTDSGQFRIFAKGRTRILRASTLPDAIDAFGLLSMEEASSGRQSRVVLQGFSESEAQGFLRTCELRFEGRPLTVRSRNSKQAVKFLSANLDFTRATITSRRAIEREGKPGVEVTLEVPEISGWKRFTLTVRAFFKTIGGRPGAMLAKATGILQQVVEKVIRRTGRSNRPLDLREELMKELQLRMPEAAGSIELEIKQEGSGLIIGFRLVDYERASDNPA